MQKYILLSQLFMYDGFYLNLNYKCNNKNKMFDYNRQ